MKLFIEDIKTLNYKQMGYRFLYWALKCSGAVTFLFAFFLIGPTLEGKFFPVVNGFEDVIIADHKTHIEVSFHATKERNCMFEELSALVKVNGVYTNARIDWMNDVGSSTRPEGHQLFGPWSVTPVGTDLIITAQHRCHPLWETATTLVASPVTK